MSHVCLTSHAKSEAQQCARDTYFKDSYNRFAKRLSAGGVAVLHSTSVKRLKYECYKVRLGKNESHRIILYDCKKHSTVYVLSVYAKNKQADISDDDLRLLTVTIESNIDAGKITKPSKTQIDTLKQQPFSYAALWNQILAALRRK